MHRFGETNMYLGWIVSYIYLRDLKTNINPQCVAWFLLTCSLAIGDREWSHVWVVNNAGHAGVFFVTTVMTPAWTWQQQQHTHPDRNNTNSSVDLNRSGQLQVSTIETSLRLISPPNITICTHTQHIESGFLKNSNGIIQFVVGTPLNSQIKMFAIQIEKRDVHQCGCALILSGSWGSPNMIR